MSNKDQRHIGRGVIVLAILLIAFLIKPAQAEDRLCYWEEMKDETIVCDALVIDIPVFHTMTSSQKADQIYTDSFIWLDDEKKEGSSILSEALEDAPSFNAVRSGPAGQQTSLFTRGTNSNHTLVTINGSAITDYSTTNGATDLNNINIHFADGLHLYTGPMSTNYGPNAVGGVVDIQTSDYKRNEISLSHGSHDTNTMSYTYGKDYFNFGIYAEGSDGISVYPQGTEPDGYDVLGFNIGHIVTLDDTQIKFTGVTNTTNADIDASGADDLDYTNETKFYFGQIQTSTDVEYGKIKTVIDHTMWDREYVNGTEIDSYDSVATHGSLDWITSSSTLSTKTGVDATGFDVDFNNTGSYNSTVDKSASVIGTYHSFDYSFANNFIISGGLRHDEHSIAKGQSTYSIGTSYKGFRISQSTGYKSPTLYEMYGADNYGYTGNSNLKPETSVSREIGYSNEGKSHSFDIALYSTEIEDMITYSNSTYNNDSDGVSTMKGADIDFNYYVGNFGFVNNIALSSAEDSSGDWLKRRPHTIIRSGITYAKDNYYITPSILYYGDHRDIDSSNWSTITVKERTTGDLTAGYYLTQDSEIVLNVKNITDDHYERPDGYNQGGRNITIGWKMKF